MSEAVALMQSQVEDGADSDLFLIQMLPGLLDKITRVVADNLRVDKLTILDGGGDAGGEGLPNYVRNVTSSAVVMLEQLKNATGVDLARIAESSASGSAGSEVPKELG